MSQMKYCYSCGAPLTSEFAGPKDNFCRYCTDSQGQVKPLDEIRGGIAQWLKSWQPGIDDKTAIARAEHYMKAMVHWAK